MIHQSWCLDQENPHGPQARASGTARRCSPPRPPHQLVVGLAVVLGVGAHSHDEVAQAVVGARRFFEVLFHRNFGGGVAASGID